MDGAEDKRITPHEPDPRWLRRLRYAREAFDLTFPPLVAVVSLGAFALLFFRSDVVTAETAGTISGVLLTAAALLYRQKKP